MAMQTILPFSGSLTCSDNLPLIASMNPCPCGFPSDPEKGCTCSVSMIKSYQKRISGPFMDRIDVHVEVPRVPFEELSDKRIGEPSVKVRKRVEAAGTVWRELFKGTNLQTNAEMGSAELCRYFPPIRPVPILSNRLCSVSRRTRTICKHH